VKLAPIFPVDAVDLCPDTGYYLCFAEHVLESKKHADVFKARSEAGATVVLDSLVYEARFKRNKTSQINFNDLQRASRMVGASYVICPDVLGSLGKTVEKYVQYRQFADKLTGTLVPVVQGGGQYQAIICSKIFYSLANTVAVPVWIADDLHLPRAQLVQQHSMAIYLGWSRNLSDRVRMSSNVVGIDSAKPVYEALGYPRRPDDYFALSRLDIEAKLPVILDSIKSYQERLGAS